MWVNRLATVAREGDPRFTDLSDTLLAWASHLVAQHRRYRQNTVCTFLSRVQRAQDASPDASLAILATSSSLLHFIQTALRTGRTPEARRTMRTALRNFLFF